MINQLPPLNGGHTRDPIIKTLQRRGFVNFRSILLVFVSSELTGAQSYKASRKSRGTTFASLDALTQRALSLPFRLQLVIKWDLVVFRV